MGHTASLSQTDCRPAFACKTFCVSRCLARRQSHSCTEHGAAGRCLALHAPSEVDGGRASSLRYSPVNSNWGHSSLLYSPGSTSAVQWEIGRASWVCEIRGIRVQRTQRTLDVAVVAGVAGRASEASSAMCRLCRAPGRVKAVAGFTKEALPRASVRARTCVCRQRLEPARLPRLPAPLTLLQARQGGVHGSGSSNAMR